MRIALCLHIPHSIIGCSIKSEKYKVSEELKRGEADALFDYIAECIDKFLKLEHTRTQTHHKIDLGFTFSFPVKQTAVDSGILLRWTKV